MVIGVAGVVGASVMMVLIRRSDWWMLKGKSSPIDKPLEVLVGVHLLRWRRRKKIKMKMNQPCHAVQQDIRSSIQPHVLEVPGAGQN